MATANVTVGQVLTYSYTGEQQSVTLPPGQYKLEAWGAQGGNAYNSTTYAGGNGGYATGTGIITADSTIYIYVGGAGAGSTSQGIQAGGWNGGGAGGYNCGGSGGGATDFRFGGTALGNRIVVAGGGGGGCYRSGYTGGAGGGSSGGNGTGYNTTYNAKGGTQSAGGAAGGYSGYTGTNGSSGSGGAANTTKTSYCRSGGGGGGYYGGGGGGYRSSSNYYYYGCSGGGGGSGYVDASLTEVSNTTSSRTGNGEAKITVIALAPDTPTGFSVESISPVGVSLSWDAVSDILGYHVYRDGSLIATISSTYFTDESLAPDTTYTYAVTAYNANLESASATVSVTTPSLQPPSNVHLAGGINSITLLWDAVDLSGVQTSYRVYRDGSLVGTASNASYLDIPSGSTSTRSYRVSTYVNGYESSQTAAVSATTRSAGAVFEQGHKYWGWDYQFEFPFANNSLTEKLLQFVKKT